MIRLVWGRVVTRPTVTVLILGALVGLVPVGQAQLTPYVRFTIAPGSGASNEVLIPEDKDIIMNFTVRVHAKDFVCAQDAKVFGEVFFKETFKHWAGSSIQQGTATFAIPVGKPANAEIELSDVDDTKGFRLEITWNKEDRPATGATETYTLFFSQMKFVQGDEGKCVQAPEFRAANEYVVMARMLDKNTSQLDPCTEDPSLPQCSPAIEPVAEDSPGVDLLAAALAISAAVGWGARRRR